MVTGLLKTRPAGPNWKTGERFVTPDGGALVVNWTVIVVLPFTAPAGMVSVVP